MAGHETRRPGGPGASKRGTMAQRSRVTTGTRGMATGAKTRRQAGAPVWGAAGLTAIIVVLVVVFALRGGNGGSSAGACPGVADGTLACGTRAPDFTLPEVPGNRQVRLSSLRGHAVFLELFAVWCPHCQAMAPVLEQIDAANRGKGLMMLSVIADPQNRREDGPIAQSDLVWFKSTFKVQHPLLWDPRVASDSVSQAAIYKVQYFPTLYVIDKNGIIRWAATGEHTQQELQTQINKVL